jgi:hypothetical protein
MPRKRKEPPEGSQPVSGPYDDLETVLTRLHAGERMPSVFGFVDALCLLLSSSTRNMSSSAGRTLFIF